MLKITEVQGSVWGGARMYHQAHVPSTYQKPACHSFDPGKGKTTYVPHTSKLQGGWDVGRLGFTNN